MKCPDCQGLLLSVSLMGFDESFRCNSCGGFWLEAWTVNKLMEGEIDKYSRLGFKADERNLTNKCPKDGIELGVPDEGLLPKGILAKKCQKCNFWWMPGDSLFDYRAAMVAKKNYQRWWGGMADFTALFLPAIMVLVMAIGLAYGVNLLRNKVQLSVPARTPKVYFSVVEKGKGIVLINLSSTDAITEAEIKKQGEDGYVIKNVEKVNNVYQVELKNLEKGVKYEIRVLGQIYEFSI